MNRARADSGASLNGNMTYCRRAAWTCMVETMSGPFQLTQEQVGRLPSVPAQFSMDIVHGQIVPDNVVYTTNGGLMPALPADPDLPKALTVTTAKTHHKPGPSGKLPNGLTRRADVFARLMARGASGAAAYRAAYNYTRSDPIALQRHAARLRSNPKVGAASERYRSVLEQEARQQGIRARDYVLARLVQESQHAAKGSERIKALELIGKTEGMFVTVSRSEKTLAPGDLKSLKTQLEQRLMQALGRLNPHLTNGSQGTSLGHGTDITPQGDETASAGPHPGAPPLFVDGSHPGSVDRTSPKRSSPLVSSDTPGYILVPVAAREMTENDL